MSYYRYSASARHITRRAARNFASSSRVYADATVAPGPNLGSVKPPKQPIGGFRGGIVGFLFGFSLASSFAAYHLLDEYKQASASLQASVLELQTTTEKVTAHVRRIEAVEKEVKALSSTSASKDDLSRLRAEVKKIYDGLDIEFLSLRSHVSGMQKDLHALAKKDASSIRV